MMLRMKKNSMKSLPNPSLIDSDSPEWIQLTYGNVKITEIKTKLAVKIKWMSKNYQDFVNYIIGVYSEAAGIPYVLAIGGSEAYIYFFSKNQHETPTKRELWNRGADDYNAGRFK